MKMSGPVLSIYFEWLDEFEYTLVHWFAMQIPMWPWSP